MSVLLNWLGFEDIENKAKQLLKNKYGKARELAEGTLAGAGREAQANLDIMAQRQGILGSPLAATLSSRLAADMARKKQQALTGIDAAEASDAANLGIQSALQRNQALANLYGNIFAGLGTIAGNLMSPAKKTT